MKRYIVRRLMQGVVLLVMVATIVFFLGRLTGNPVDLINRGEMDARISPAAYHQMLHLYGLDQPLHVRYFTWLKRVATLDFGDSFLDHRPVTEKIIGDEEANRLVNVPMRAPWHL